MSKMKTEFKLEHSNTSPSSWTARIIGQKPKYRPYVSFTNDDLAPLFIADKDLERFAVNILRALKSKKLKP